MTNTARFAIPMPEDGDAPNLPAQLQTAAERIEVLLGYAGAQAKATEIAGDQGTTSSTFVELGTPDRIDDLVVPAKALLLVGYHALATPPSNPNAEAAIFLDDGTTLHQLKGTNGNALKTNITYGTHSTKIGMLFAQPLGLAFTNQPTAGSDAAEVTTPVTMSGGSAGVADTNIHGPLLIRLPAATYDLSIRYRAPGGGTVSAKNRHLYARVLEHA